MTPLQGGQRSRDPRAPGVAPEVLQDTARTFLLHAVSRQREALPAATRSGRTRQPQPSTQRPGHPFGEDRGRTQTGPLRAYLRHLKATKPPRQGPSRHGPRAGRCTASRTRPRGRGDEPVKASARPQQRRIAHTSQPAGCVLRATPSARNSRLGTRAGGTEVTRLRSHSGYRPHRPLHAGGWTPRRAAHPPEGRPLCVSTARGWVGRGGAGGCFTTFRNVDPEPPVMVGRKT